MPGGIFTIIGTTKQTNKGHYRKLRFCRVHHSLPCANSRAHGKHDCCRVCSRKHTAKPKHTAKSWFAVCFFLAHGMCFFVTHGKVMVCRVLFFGTRQSNKIFFCLLTLKLFLLFTYNMWHSMLKFDTFLYLFVIFN